MRNLTKEKAIFAILLATVFWGTTYPTIKFGLSELYLPPLTFLFLRFLVATVSLCPLLFIKPIREEVFWALQKPYIILLGIFNGISYSLQYIGQVSTTAGIATIMVNTYVLFAPIFAHFIFKKKIDLRKKLAIITGFLGVATIAMGDIISSEENTSTLLGTLLVLGCGLLAGVYVAYSEKVMKNRYNEKPLNPLAVFLSSTIFTLLLIIIEGLAFRDLAAFTHIELRAFFIIVYLGIFCTGGAFVLYLYSIKELGSVNSAVFMLLQIIISITISTTLLKEILNVFMLCGGFLIVVAIYLVQKSKSVS